MRIYWLGLLIAVFGVFATSQSHALTEPEDQKPDAIVQVYTESYPPYSYINDQGNAVGLSVQYVRQIMEHSGLKFQISVMPWSRAMQRALTEDNALIFAMARTKQREATFDWLAYISSVNYYLFARSDDDRTVSLAALQAGEFRVTCLQSDISCDLLASFNIPISSALKITEINRPDVRLVYHGRADLYIGPKAFNASHLLHQGLPADAMKPVFKMGHGGDMYLAAAKTVKKDIRDRVRKSYEVLKESGQLIVVPSELSP